MALRALIFDMDGVLFDTERVAADTWLEAGAAFGFTLSDGFIKGTVGMDQGMTRAYYHEAFAGRFPYDQVEARRTELFRSRIQARGVPMKPGVVRILEEARRLGLCVALGTSSRAVYAYAMLWLAGIDGHFHALVTRDLVQAAKPAPDIFQKAAAMLGIDPGDCLVFEDSSHGIHAAEAAGMPVIMVPDLIEPTAELRAKCVGVYATLAEAARRLEGMLAAS
ncbi:MAG: HAD family phosphatase [Holophaga sp.]|nr:HAD family phosphatase [Holophaga sp.]